MERRRTHHYYSEAERKAQRIRRRRIRFIRVISLRVLVLSLLIFTGVKIANVFSEPKEVRGETRAYDTTIEKSVIIADNKPEDIIIEEAPKLIVDYNINSIDLDAWDPSNETIEETEIEEYTVDTESEDYKYLCMVLTGECQPLSVDDQILYGSVVLNRVASKRFPDTIKEVCLQKGQYACFKDGNAYRNWTSNTMEAAEYLLTNGSQLPSNVVFQAEFKQGNGVYLKLGNTYFCYLD